MSNINDVPSYGNGATPIFQGMGLGVRTYVCTYGLKDRRTDVLTDGHVSSKIFEIDGLPNFLRYGAPLARLVLL